MAAEKILILEDDPLVARVYAKALREDGKDVTVCTRFEDAREKLKNSRPDAILTDVRVGEYNGLQLAHLFRMTSPAGRVVVVSGYDDSVVRKEVSELHGQFILKPIGISDLRSAFAPSHQQLAAVIVAR